MANSAGSYMHSYPAGTGAARPHSSVAPTDIASASPRLVEAVSPVAGGEPSSALSSYVAEVGSVPLLTRQQEKDLAEVISECAHALHRELLRIPWTARFLLARWSEGPRRSPASGEALQKPGRDEVLGRLRALVERRDELAAGGGGRAEQKQLDDRIRALSMDADFEPKPFEEALTELRSRRIAMSRRTLATRERSSEDLAREMGLPAKTFRRRMLDVEVRAQALDVARNRFAEHNLRLVIKVAREFSGMGVPFADLVQEGNLGLLRAVEKFDPRRGFKFSTYGCWWIRQGCIRAIQNHSRTIRLPSHRFDRVLRIHRTEAKMMSRLGRAPDANELSREMGMSPEQLEDHLAFDHKSVSLEAQFSDSDDRTVGDVLPDATDVDPVDLIQRHSSVSRLDALLVGLPVRERQVLRWRFGLGGDGPYTLAEVGQRLGLCRERVRQIEAAALIELKDQFADGQTADDWCWEQ